MEGKDPLCEMSKFNYPHLLYICRASDTQPIVLAPSPYLRARFDTRWHNAISSYTCVLPRSLSTLFMIRNDMRKFLAFSNKRILEICLSSI